MHAFVTLATALTLCYGEGFNLTLPRERGINTASKPGPTHKRAEGRAPMWGSEFTKKPLHYRGVHLNSCPAFVYVGLGPVVARARVLVHDVLDRGA
jgi:hypothetical protein